MRILGIDPGTTGAYALFQSDKSAESGLRWQVGDLPSATEFRDLLRKWEPEICYFEDTFQVFASTKASYRLGKAVGEALGVLYCCDTPVILVHPRTWQAYFRLKAAGKDGSLELARQFLSPQIDALRRKLDHNRAEAVLIAAYGSSKLL